MKHLKYSLAFLVLLGPAAAFAQTCPAMEISVTCNRPQGIATCNVPTELTVPGLNWQGIGCIYYLEEFEIILGRPQGSTAQCDDPDRLTLTSNIANWQGSFVVHERYESQHAFGSNFPWDKCYYSILTSAPFQ